MTYESRIHETAALIALLRRGDRIWHHYAELVEARGSALTVLHEPDPDALAAPKLFPDEDPEPADLDAIVAELGAWQREGMSVISVLDEAYPANLRTIHNRPPLLFVRGSLVADDERSVAVVGTRRASAEGLAHARAVAEGLVDARYTVVSGLADGIDTAAHLGALESGGRTVAVIGTGLRRAYPAGNADLQERIGGGAAVVSQFWPDAPPTKTSFPMRNVVMSGLARATVVIEASHTSGARMQARFALEHGRPVFLLESLLEHQWAQDYAERAGTYVVRTASEVVEHVERLVSLDVLTA
ncbi:MAG: DNA-protecting protein DprA [Actinomycetota bacterium]|nr:DNA-protecting protein DprA [Actinomycetota bacterium]